MDMEAWTRSGEEFRRKLARRLGIDSDEPDDLSYETGSQNAKAPASGL